jgi:hypothetical protein
VSWRATRTQPTAAQRRRVLERDPLCRLRYPGVCTGYSTEVDHVVAGSVGHVTDDELQGVCHDCHQRKSRREQAAAAAASNRQRAAARRARPRPPAPHPGRRGLGDDSPRTAPPAPPIGIGPPFGCVAGKLRF